MAIESLSRAQTTKATDKNFSFAGNKAFNSDLIQFQSQNTVLLKSVKISSSLLATAFEKEEAHEQELLDTKELNEKLEAEAGQLREQQKMLQDQYFTLEEQYTELAQQMESNQVLEVIAQSQMGVPHTARRSNLGSSPYKPLAQEKLQQRPVYEDRATQTLGAFQDTRLLAIQAQLEQSSKYNHALQKTVTKLQNKVEVTQQKYVAARSKLREFETELTQEQKSFLALQKEVDSLNETIQCKDQELERTKQSIERRNQKILVMDEEYMGLQAAFKQSQVKIQRLQREVMQLNMPRKQLNVERLVLVCSVAILILVFVLKLFI